MHVHVAPLFNPSGKFKLHQLKQIMKAVAYYDQPITDIMPPERKYNDWAMSNWQGKTAPAHFQKAYQSVNEDLGRAIQDHRQDRARKQFLQGFRRE